MLPAACDALAWPLIPAALDSRATVMALLLSVPVAKTSAGPLPPTVRASSAEGAVLGRAPEIVGQSWRLRLEAFVAVHGPAIPGLEGYARGIAARGAFDRDQGALVLGAGTGLVRGSAGGAAPVRAVDSCLVAGLFSGRRAKGPAAIGTRVRVALVGERHPGASIVDAWRPAVRVAVGAGFRSRRRCKGGRYISSRNRESNVCHLPGACDLWVSYTMQARIGTLVRGPLQPRPPSVLAAIVPRSSADRSRILADHCRDWRPVGLTRERTVAAAGKTGVTATRPVLPG